MKHFRFLAIATSMLMAAAALSFIGCNGDDNPTVEFSVAPLTLEFDAIGGTQNLAVTGDWDQQPTTDAAWITFATTATRVAVTAAANTGEARTASIKVGTATVAVTQKAAGDDPVNQRLSATPTSLTFVAESAPAQDVTVTAENVGTWSANSTDTWITIAEREGAFSVTVSDNTETTERTGTISLTATEYTGVVTITVMQSRKPAEPSGDYPDLAGSYDVTSTKAGIHPYDFPTNFSTNIVNMPDTEIDFESGTEYWNLYEIDPWLIDDYALYLHYTDEGKLVLEDQLYLFTNSGNYVYSCGVTINSENVISSLQPVGITIDSNGDLIFASTIDKGDGIEPLYVLFMAFDSSGNYAGSVYSDASTNIKFTKTTRAGGTSSYTVTYKSIAKEDLSVAPGVSLNRPAKNISVR